MSTSKASAQRPIAKPKSMSSKLLTMKFMQRSAAPTAVREALAKEESKRDAAREKMAAAVSSTAADAETRWELSYVQTVHRGQAARVVDWGYSEILGDRREDSDEEDEEEGEKEKASGGRMVFGAFKSKGEAAKTEGDDGEESNEGEGGSEDGDGDGDGPRMVSLRGLTSISNAGPPPPGMKCRGCGEEGHTQANCPRARCYACDGEGHMAMDCPRPRKGRKRETMAHGSDSKRRRLGN